MCVFIEDSVGLSDTVGLYPLSGNVVSFEDPYIINTIQ